MPMSSPAMQASNDQESNLHNVTSIFLFVMLDGVPTCRLGVEHRQVQRTRRNSFV